MWGNFRHGGDMVQVWLDLFYWPHDGMDFFIKLPCINALMDTIGFDPLPIQMTILLGIEMI
jgi:hypothetical protein